MSKKSSTFAPDFDENHYLRRFYATRRDGGIGRHEGLKILWPVMAVPVRPRLAVRKAECGNTLRFFVGKR